MAYADFKSYIADKFSDYLLRQVSLFVDEYHDGMGFHGVNVLAINRQQVADLFKAYCFDREFKKLVDSGQFVFVDRHLVLKDEKYVSHDQTGNITLSEYALSHMEECRSYLFYDAALGSSELSDLMARAEKKNATALKAREAEDKRREKDKGLLSDEEYSALRPVSLEELLSGHDELGTITLKTSRLELSAVEAYLLYKQRQAIEVSFRTLDTELDGDSSYMQDKDTFDGWLFLNHLSLMLANDTIEHLKRKGLNSTYSFEDVRSYLRQIHATSINGNWIPNVRRSKIGRLCDKLCFDAAVITLPIGHST